MTFFPCKKCQARFDLPEASIKNLKSFEQTILPDLLRLLEICWKLFQKSYDITVYSAYTTSISTIYYSKTLKTHSILYIYILYKMSIVNKTTAFFQNNIIKNKPCS